MVKPRFVAITDDHFKQRVKLKALRQNKTVSDVILDLLKKWIKK